MYVNEGESGITQDWNFAYSKVQTDYVTIAHQDDKYAPEYVENLLAYTAKAKKAAAFLYRLCRDKKWQDCNNQQDS